MVYLLVVGMGFYSFLTTQFFTNDPPVRERVAHADKELKTNQTFQVKSFHTLPDKEITLLDAYELGFKKAKEYDKNPVRIVRDKKNIFISVSGERNGKRVDVYYQEKTGEHLGRFFLCNGNFLLPFIYKYTII